MVDIPYHTHTFDIPTASEGEIRAGLEAGKAITPDRLFPVLADKADKATTLAGYGITDAATKEQGLKADTAVQPAQVSAVGFSGRYADLLNKPNLGDASTMNVGTSAGTIAAGDDARIVGAVQKATTVTAGAGLAGGGTLATNIAVALSSTSLASLALADSAVQPAALLAYATKTELIAGLTGKSDVGHKHPISDVTGLQNALDAKAATIHTHSIVQVTGLQTALDSKATIEQGGKADTAVQPADIANFTTKSEMSLGLDAKLDAGAQAVDSALLNGQTAAQIINGLAKTSDLGALASKSKVDIDDINATGNASGLTVLYGDGVWRVPTGGGGGGGMDATVYDPRGIGGDAFLQSNMTEGLDAKILTADERAGIAANTAARHSHSNKAVLDATTASYLAAEKTKLAGIPSNATANTGTVTSVAVAVPTGLSVAGSPITSTGTITITYSSGYVGYTTTEKTKLAGITAGAQVNVPQVQSDWNAASGVSAIQNKPLLGTAAAQNMEAFATSGQGNKADNAVRYNEAQALTDPQKAQVRANIGASNFGEVQTWQDLAGSRVPDTVYVNNTGKPIFVSMTAVDAMGMDRFVKGELQIVDPTNVLLGGYTNGASGVQVAQGIVPAGASYKAIWQGGFDPAEAVFLWSEFR
ncbi:hypothetical protein [Pseudochrobactrum kiredjianiae]|uniref:Tail fiber protein n=1 Tax=Pseudochrobactrum kiredjianiae TaxID=386305 RepID=A0ABW3V1D4_9HYPH|nr:hypothetical protein [Pseudochrobactrum kiredjianiae]MDM7852374.1 hypothetical protein [Pseudochrobactrum kiredjianiae]